MRGAVLVFAVALGATVSAADAKGPVSARVCGATCRQIRDHDLAYRLLPSGELPFEVAALPRPAPYYAIALRSPGEDGLAVRLLYAPSRGAVRVDDSDALTRYRPPPKPYWRAPDPAERRALDRATKGLRPRPARPWPAGGG